MNAASNHNDEANTKTGQAKFIGIRLSHTTYVYAIAIVLLLRSSLCTYTVILLSFFIFLCISSFLEKLD